MNVQCIVIARGGSKGIPGKNIIDFCGQPLISWTINQAKKTKLISEVWVSSDNEKILDISGRYGAKTILRPKEFSTDTSSSEDAWAHALQHIIKKIYKPIDFVVVPQVTSPIRNSYDFDRAILQIQEENSDSLLSVNKIEDRFIWSKDKSNFGRSVNYDYKNRRRRQEIEVSFLENGSFYIFRPEVLLKKKNRLADKISLYEMERHKMFQIDSPEDIKLAEVVMSGYGLDFYE